MDLDELASQAVDRETGTLTPPRDHERTVSTALHRRHLPRPAEAGVITYDADDIYYRSSPRLESHLADERNTDLP
ncbi:hypothetical protein BRD03_09580 [Halobacteriales archaeon QS_9_68_17]|nr:MAG: hypothetical protein BRD03_09580 [Halobacteriales archaeon QS_9_68_17]